jgi:hypothetical protein
MNRGMSSCANYAVSRLSQHRDAESPLGLLGKNDCSKWTTVLAPGSGGAAKGGDGGALGSGGLAPCPEGTPSDDACARASDVAAAASPVAQVSTAGTLAVAWATAVPPPVA